MILIVLSLATTGPHPGPPSTAVTTTSTTTTTMGPATFTPSKVSTKSTKNNYDVDGISSKYGLDTACCKYTAIDNYYIDCNHNNDNDYDDDKNTRLTNLNFDNEADVSTYLY